MSRSIGRKLLIGQGQASGNQTCQRLPLSSNPKAKSDRLLGDFFYHLRHQDARIELATCGAGLEWALALGASFLPRNFGGYDETTNSLLIASFLGRTKQVQGDPAANRMHAVLDGLLAVSAGSTA